MSEIEEMKKKIRECVAEIEPYKIFSPQVDLAVKALKDVEDLITDLNEENTEKALKIVNELYKNVRLYSGYVPTTASNLKSVKEWLEKTRM